MSGTAGVSTLFANAVTATGAQLDANYGTIVAYVNDPTNRNNYAPGGAVTNTVALTFAPPVVGGYTAGLELTWKWGTLNTGGVVVNANGLGNASLVNSDGSALQAGQAIAGSMAKAAYDGTNFIFLAPPSPASKAAMQTATASATFVTPAQVINNPGVAKAMAAFIGTNTGTITAQSAYNISSIVRTGVGTYSVTFTNAFANTAYVVLSMSQFSSVMSEQGSTRTTAGFALVSVNPATAAAADAAQSNFAVFGALP